MSQFCDRVSYGRTEAALELIGSRGSDLTEIKSPYGASRLGSYGEPSSQRSASLFASGSLKTCKKLQIVASACLLSWPFSILTVTTLSS